jgi:hypothetical protein
MKIVWRNLVCVDDVSPATAPEIFDGRSKDYYLSRIGVSPKRKG